MTQSNLGFYQSEVRDQIAYQLVNFNDISQFAIRAETIRKIAYRDVGLAQRGVKVDVIAVVGTAIAQGVVHMYERCVTNPAWEVHYVQSLQEAWTWLGHIGVRKPEALSCQ